MSERTSLRAAGTLTVAGLVAAAAGIAIQVLSGVDEYPTIPPGLVILLVVAGLIILGARWRWTPLLGVAVAGFILFGAFVTPGTAIQMLGLCVALLAGIVAALQGARRPAAGR